MSVTIDPPDQIAVYLELGSKRLFASAVAWPGWCRSGKDERSVLEALAAAAPRYAAVANEAGLSFPPVTVASFQIVERLPGSITTDFGAPDSVASGDAGPLTPVEATRLATLVAAAWAVFDRVVANAPSELRKGPRGGGRDRDRMVEHVVGAEVMYARKIGIRVREPAAGDKVAVASLRKAIGQSLCAASNETVVADKGWPARYAARRIAWHVLDHVWEIEDRSG
jgi:hypothetical protein